MAVIIFLILEVQIHPLSLSLTQFFIQVFSWNDSNIDLSFPLLHNKKVHQNKYCIQNKPEVE